MRFGVIRSTSFLALAVLVAACSSSPVTPQGPSQTLAASSARTTDVYMRAHPVCGAVSAGFVRCHAWQVDGLQTYARQTISAAKISGYHPADLQSAYALPSTSAGYGKTVAIVDAYDDPNAERDLGVYRSMFGLPACTAANGCFRKLNQSGVQGHYTSGNSGWGAEISLDLDMVSAICPRCRIVLVEANSNAWTDLFASVAVAAALKPTAISNSYGGGEFPGEIAYASSYNHPGIAITASTGDGGYGVEFPAASSYVTAVGGTSLTKASNARGWSETAWNGAGSGCSAYIAKPSWQTDLGCPNRTAADVSAIADPSTGVSVYDTYGQSGWLVYGGTSVASPIVASVYALAGNTTILSYGSYSYAHTSSLFDVISGSNGSCGGSYLCTGRIGYDGPTGLGTPNGIGAF